MVRLYADECVNGVIIRALRQRSIDILTAQEDGRGGDADPMILDRATELGRILFSQDHDLLVVATRWQRAGMPFSGVIFAHQQDAPTHACIDDLELIAGACDPEEFGNRVEFLPLRRRLDRGVMLMTEIVSLIVILQLALGPVTG